VAPVFVLCGLALACFPGDAHAWGLQSHVFFAHYALLFTPLADRELRAAARRLPGMVLAGACLPDLALAGVALGTPAFRRAHRWSTLARMAAAPRDDAERALALGYGSHLLADVIAHNLFVPEHEARLVRLRHVTHALAEWAMDDHLAARAPARPSDVLALDQEALIAFIARGFRCGEPLAARALRLLRRADGVLRSTPAPRACRAVVRLFDRRLGPRFDAYIRRTTGALQSVEAALAGRFVDWKSSDPEGKAGDRGADRRARQHIARIVQAQHHP